MSLEHVVNLHLRSRSGALYSDQLSPSANSLDYSGTDTNMQQGLCGNLCHNLGKAWHQKPDEKHHGRGTDADSTLFPVLGTACYSALPCLPQVFRVMHFVYAFDIRTAHYASSSTVSHCSVLLPGICMGLLDQCRQFFHTCQS